MDTLNNAQVPVLGAIMNKLKRGHFGISYGYPAYYDYYYNKYYGASDSDRTNVNGVGPVGRPVRWVRSIVSKARGRDNRG